jgi:hypothetical protein
VHARTIWERRSSKFSPRKLNYVVNYGVSKKKLSIMVQLRLHANKEVVLLVGV